MGSEANAPQSTLETRATLEARATLDAQEKFLSQYGWRNAVRSALPGDFSARYYVRLNNSGRKALLMVMPSRDELMPFLTMQAALAQGGMRVPEIIASDEANGLAIVEDLGEQDFTAMLRGGMPPEQLYPIAIDALSYLHQSPLPPSEQLTRFTPQLFLDQVGLFLDNYATHILKIPFSITARTTFVTAWYPALEFACAIPSSLMLRDFHAANIMYLEHETGFKKAAAIDFQDGGIGPISYDIASLLEDARLDIPHPLRAQMLERYLAASSFKNTAAFMTSFHILACQRHMRILAILAKRLAGGVSPQTEEYFKRVWSQIVLHQAEPTLAPVYQWLDEYVPEQARSNWKPPA
ncbi:MAG: phosphotransferase [Alphaproteobacteria bacterium]|nr:phosphotransferase [Alphaproteobacteria bacterium]